MFSSTYKPSNLSDLQFDLSGCQCEISLGDSTGNYVTVLHIGGDGDALNTVKPALKTTCI